MKKLIIVLLITLFVTQFPWSKNRQGDGSSPWPCAQGSGPC